MTKIFLFLIAIGCFSLGFSVSEYRHHHNTSPRHSQPAHQHPEQLQLQATDTAKFEASATQAAELNLFSWQHVNQLIAGARYEDAISQLIAQLEVTPDSAQAWHLLAKAHGQRGDHASALSAWFHYLEVENDAVKRDQAYHSIKDYLLRLYTSPSLINDDTFWLITQLDQLLGLTDDSELHLTLASLYSQIDDNYQAQYHALMAANDSKVQAQAEKILAQLNGTPVPEGLTVPLIRFGNQYLVQVNIEGYPARLLLDTGASLSGVSNAYAARHADLVKQTKPIRLNTAAGITDTYLFTADHFTVGTLTFNQHILALLPMQAMTDFDGLLGVDILGRFDFVIDQDALVLRLQARKN